MSFLPVRSGLILRATALGAAVLAFCTGSVRSQSATQMLADTFRYADAPSTPRLMASPEEIQRAVSALTSGDSNHRSRLDTSISKALTDIDTLQARYRSANPSFGFDARSILTEAAMLHRIARGVHASTGSPSSTTLNLLRDELVQVEMDLVDALQRVGSTSTSIHVGQGSNIQPLAVIYDFLYDEFTPAQRQSIASAIILYGIIPSFNGMLAPMNQSDRKWWAKNTSINNWSTIILGGGIMGSLAIRQQDYDGYFSCWPGTSNAGSRVTRSFREHFDAYLPAALSLLSTAWRSSQDMGGMWDEGPGYSHDFIYPLLGTAVSLESARRETTNLPASYLTDFATLTRQASVSMIQMGIHFAGPSRREFTHNDGNWSYTDQAACYRLADFARQSDPSSAWRAAAWRARDRSPTTWSGLHLLWHALFDWQQSISNSRGMSGFDPTAIPLARYFHSARIEASPTARSGSNEHIAIWRQSWTDTNSTAVFLKGGDKRADRHEHLDTGDFLFDSLGVRWNADLGPPVGYPSYRPPSPDSGSTSYQTYPKRAMGQNTLVVNPTRNDYLARAVPKAWLDAVQPDQAMDDGLSSHWAPLENLNTSAAASTWTARINLSTAYARHGIRTAAQGAPADPVRSFNWDRGTGALEIRDSLHFAQADNEVFWYWHLPGTSHKPVYLSENRVVLQAVRDSMPVYLNLEVLSSDAFSNGGFKYGRIDENLPSSRPSDTLLWGYDNATWQRTNLRKLALRFTTSGTSMDVRVKATPLPQLTGLSESAALIQLGLLETQASVACSWPLNGTLDNAHGGTALVAGTSAPQWISGAAEGSGAVLFDGVDDELRTVIPLDFGDRITVAAWIRTTPGAANIQTIAANTASGAANGFKFYVNNYNTSDGALVFETANGSQQSKASTAPGAIPAGTWTHVAAVIDRTNSHTRLFVNGVLITLQSSTRADFTPDGTLYLGRMAPGGGAFPFSGSLDDVRHLPRALPASEIRLLAAPGPAHRWTFQNDARDVTGAAPIPTLMLGASLSSSTTRGGLQSLVVDGNDDAVNLGALALGDAFTFSGWVRIQSGRSSMQTLLFSRPTGATTGTGIHLYANSWTTTDRKLHLNTGNGTLSSAIASPTNAVPFGEWVHIAAVIQRTAATARLYVNGAEVASGAIRPDLPDNMPLFLGSMGGGSFTQNLQGNFDEVRIDKRALSAAEIAGLASSPGSPPVIQGISLQPDPPVPGQPVTLTTSATDPDASDRLRHSVLWGDGTAPTPWSPLASPAPRTYTTQALHTAVARVDDGTFISEASIAINLALPNTPPSISAPSSWQGSAGQISVPLALTVGDAETPAGNLIVSSNSGLPHLIPDTAVTISGSTTSRFLNVEIPAWAFGSVPIVLTVSDGSLSASTTVTLQITNNGWGNGWIASQSDDMPAWSQPSQWSDDRVPVSGPDAVLRFFEGRSLPGMSVQSHQDLSHPFILSEWILGGIGPTTEGGTFTLTGSPLRLVAPPSGGPARVRLDATSGAGFSYVIGVPVELAADTEFSGNGDASFIFAGPLSGGGTLTKSGSSALGIGGVTPHTLTGPWRLAAGSLVFEPGLDHRIPTNSTVNFTGSASWDLGGNQQSITGLDLVNATHQSALQATICDGSLLLLAPSAITLGPTTSNIGPVSANSCLLDLSTLESFTFQSTSDLSIQPKTYNTQSASSTLRLGDAASLTAKRLHIGGMAGGGAHSGTLELGLSNVIRADEIAIGRSARTSGILRHRSGITGNATTLLRASNGTSRISKLQLGEQWGGSGDNTATADFTGGSVDALVDLLEIGRATANSRPSTATLTLGPDGGVLDANQITLGMAEATASGAIQATIQQQGGIIRTPALVFGSTSGQNAPTLSCLYQMQPGSTLECASITAGAAGRAAAASERTLRFHGGLLTTHPSSSTLRIAGKPQNGTLILDVAASATLLVPHDRTAVIEPTARLAGSGTLRKTGPGRLISHSAGSTFSGSMEILAGSLEITSDAAAGAPPASVMPEALTIDGGTLVLNRGWQGEFGLVSAGSGHTTFPTLDLTGVSGESIQTHGGIATLSILQQGNSNHTAATISFTAPDLPGGIQATATGILTGGRLTSVTLTQPGSGYTVPPRATITLTGGSQVSVPPVLGLTVAVQGALVLNPGHDAEGSAPAVSLIGGGGSGTVFSATAGTTAPISLHHRRGLRIGAGGANLGCVGNHEITGPVSGPGSLTKTLPGTLSVTGSRSYTGDTRVHAGVLRFTSAALADEAMVSIQSGASLRLDFIGTDEIAGLVLEGVSMPPGIYQESNSNGHILGSGQLRVTGSAFQSWIEAAFPGITATANTGFQADPDADGIPNGIEFLLGSDPTRSTGTSWLPSLSTEAGTLRFIFRRSAAARSLAFQIEAATDPSGPWLPLAHGLDGTSIREETDAFAQGVDRVTVTLPQASHAARFLRLAASQP